LKWFYHFATSSNLKKHRQKVCFDKKVGEMSDAGRMVEAGRKWYPGSARFV
jgi:hypothetical protein